MPLIENKTEFVCHIGIMLRPGLNLVSDLDFEDFQNALNNPLNKILVESGQIVTVEEKNTVSDLDETKALEVIQNTQEISTLSALLSDEKDHDRRSKVIDCIQRRIMVLQQTR